MYQKFVTYLGHHIDAPVEKIKLFLEISAPTNVTALKVDDILPSQFISKLVPLHKLY